MANKPLRPCRHPGCTVLVPDGYCDAHRPKDRDRRSQEARPGAGCTRPTNGPRTCSLRSSCRSLSAGRAPKGGSGCGPRMWTTSSPIAETGPSFTDQANLQSLCHRLPQAGKRPWNCGKTGGKAGGDEHAALPDAWAHGRAQAPAQVRGQDFLPALPPGVKKLRRPAQDRTPLFWRGSHGRGEGAAAGGRSFVSNLDTGKEAAGCRERDSPRRCWRPMAASI